MRNVRSVFKKLKEVKHVHTVKLYKIHLKRTPENCKYNFKYAVSDKVTIRLCLLHQPEVDLEHKVFPHLIDICQDMQHCKSCDAYICRHDKKEVQAYFNKTLEDQKFKAKEYPDICALEWVLERSVVGIPPLNYIEKFWFYIKRILSKKIF